LVSFFERQLLKKALITGATSGFGLMVAKKLLAKGWFVYATGRKITERLGDWREIQEKYKNTLRFLDLDVTKPEERQRAVGQIENLDVLINNAGVGVFGAFEDLSEEQIRKQFEVNFFGAVMLTQELLPKIRESSGRIINVSSAFGIVGFPLASMYCATKFALEGWSESLAYEVSPMGVSVCIIEPGAFDTGFNKSIEWGVRSDSSSSSYKGITQGYKARSTKNITGPDSAIVADGIVQATIAKSVAMRIAIGQDTKIAVRLKHFLPRQMFFKILSRVYSKSLGLG